MVNIGSIIVWIMCPLQFLIIDAILRLRARPADKEVPKYKTLVKEMKIIMEKLDKHIISESLSLVDIKKFLIKAVALHRQVKDMQGKGDAKTVAGSKGN